MRRLKNGRKLRAVLGAVVVALLLSLLISAVSVVRLILPAVNGGETALPVWTLSAVGLLGGLLSLLVSVGVIYYAVLTLVRRKIREAQSWPATQGVVLASEVRDAGGESGWYAKVVYRYEVGGRVYENSRIAVAVEPGDQSFRAQERLAARFPAGARVPVYYDPRNPADAALIKGDPNSWAPSWFSCL